MIACESIATITVIEGVRKFLSNGGGRLSECWGCAYFDGQWNRCIKRHRRNNWSRPYRIWQCISIVVNDASLQFHKPREIGGCEVVFVEISIHRVEAKNLVIFACA